MPLNTGHIFTIFKPERKKYSTKSQTLPTISFFVFLSLLKLDNVSLTHYILGRFVYSSAFTLYAS